MATLNGAQAGDRLLGFGTVTPGTCLNAVWRAFGSPKSDGRYPYATATEALKRARELGAIKGYDINTAPEGAVLFWSNVWGNWKSGYGDAGHIAIKGPNNTVTTIDLPVRGRVGRVKPSAIWKHIKFEGWALGDGAFLGHAVTSPANLTLSKPKAVAAESAAPIPQEEDTMYPINWGGHKFTVGKQFIKHEINGPNAEFVKNVFASNDQFVDVSDEKMRAVCASLGIEPYALDQVLKGKGPGGDGRVWSRELEIILILRNEIPDASEQRVLFEDVLKTVKNTPVPKAK